MTRSTEPWIQTVLDIADQRLGREYLDPNLLRNSVESDSPYFTSIAVSNPESNNNQIPARDSETLSQIHSPGSICDTQIGVDSETELAGFCLGAVFSQTELQQYLHVSPEELPANLKRADRIGVVRTIAVRDSCENHGVGTALTDSCLRTAFSRGATILCAVGWRNGDTVNISGIMDRFGFEADREYDGYWGEESVRVGYHCPRCGSPPCTCSAILFTRTW